MTIEIAPIVEGHGEVAAVPLLIRAIDPSITVHRPVRCPKSKLVPRPLDVSFSEVRRFAAMAAANLKTKAGLVLLMVDADTDCAAQLGPRLLEAMTSANVVHRAAVAIVCREFESWIVGGVEEFNDQTPETTGDPKGRIRLDNLGRYSPSADQPRYTARIDINLLTQRSQSFARLRRIIGDLVQPQL